MATRAPRLDAQPLGRSEIRESGELCARAFDDDPFYGFLMPKVRRRHASIARLHRTVLTHLAPDERSITARSDTNQIQAVALWLPPGGFPLSVRVQLAQLPGGIRAMGYRLQSLRVGSAYQEASIRNHPKEPHWYLWLLAVDPEFQRQGVGGALLREGLDRADVDGVGSYLETQNEANVAYYGRFGYELVNTLSPVPGGPVLYTMWRSAKP